MVEAKMMTNIYDKQIPYIIIGEGKDKAIIQCGTKTFNTVSKLTEEKTEKVEKEAPAKKAK